MTTGLSASLPSRDAGPVRRARRPRLARVAATSRRGRGRKLKVIVTGGHPGDPEYGCGGTVARYTDLGHEVVLLYLNNGERPDEPPEGRRPRIAEAGKACEILKARPALRRADRRQGGRRRGPLRGVPQDPGGRAARRRLHPLADRQPRRPPRHLDAGLRRLAADGEDGSPSTTTRSPTARTPCSSPRPTTSTSRRPSRGSAGLLRPRQPGARQVLRPAGAGHPAARDRERLPAGRRLTSATSRAPTSSRRRGGLPTARASPRAGASRPAEADGAPGRPRPACPARGRPRLGGCR